VLSGADQHSFTAQAGAVYYYKQYAHMPWGDPQATSEIEHVPAIEGERGAAKCRQASIHVTND
jgi:hypothetical protein